ncbi:hypothetical protein NDU88_002357 [Pleurodeles waltl]|uniref:CCHC-type domain-containing protein n=1 Tax=Pleurodeles waltl TaxID=8319 RepID=A0AAV7M3W3_PLEWA|nr:hypothetical protein NDU88_002357 [Pleurodeles waltl]
MSRPLNPWFHNTVKLQKKVELDGSTPELSRKTFTAAGDQDGVHSSRDLVHNVGCTQRHIPADVHVGINLQEILADVLVKTGLETLLRLPPGVPTRDGGQEDDRARLQPARQHPGPDHLPTPPLHSDERTLPQPGQEGHTAKACKEEAPCNLCGAVGHLFKDCPQRAKYYAQAAKPPGRAAQEEAATASLPVPAPRKTKETGRRKGPRQEQIKPDQGSTPALEPQSTEEEMPAIPESGPTDNAPQPAFEIQEEGPWMKQERRKRRHSPPQVTKKTRKKHLSNHNPNSDQEESEEEEQPGNVGPDDQLDQVTRVLQEMRALASIMEASPPPLPATAEKEETSMEEEEQCLPANLEEEEPETSHVGKPASEKHQATVAKTTAHAPETRQEPGQPWK